MYSYKVESLENLELNQVLLTWGEDMLFSKAVNYALDLRKRYPHLSFKIKQDRPLEKHFVTWEEWQNN